MSVTLTVAAQAAVQFLGTLDSGEGLSTQQLADALLAANNILSNLTNEQTLAVQILIAEQAKILTALTYRQAAEVAPLVTRQGQQGLFQLTELSREGVAIATSFTLAAGVYTAGTFTPATYTGASVTAPSFAPGTPPQFADNTTPITLPVGWYRLLNFLLAIELAPQYSVAPSDALLKDAAQALAAATPVPNKTPVPGTGGQPIALPESTDTPKPQA
jgi:hypothetical protein